MSANYIIFGFGRSGTSMMGGLFSDAGYYTGENSYEARSSNPKGFFEDARINNINERILEKYDYKGKEQNEWYTDKQYSPMHPRYGHRWLSYIVPGTVIKNEDQGIKEDILGVLSTQQTFAFKDPRFSYTINVWQEFLPRNTKYICVFRDPSSVVNSVLTECSNANYLRDFYIDKELVYLLWSNCYKNILGSLFPDNKERMLFISYDHLVNGDECHELSNFMGTSLPLKFIDPWLNRAVKKESLPKEIRELYNELLDISGFKFKPC